MSSFSSKVTGDPAFSMFNLSLREEWLNNKKFCHRLSDDEVIVFIFTLVSSCESGSGLNPDSTGSLWIRIRIRIRCPDPIPGWKA
jgi:hypothetical protein